MAEYSFEGKHLIAEYYNLDYENLATCEQVKYHLEKAMLMAEVTCVGTINKVFEPEGYTIVAALQESHISVHAYPEHKAMFIDVFTCGDKDPIIIHKYLIRQLKVADYSIDVISRGSGKRISTEVLGE